MHSNTSRLFRMEIECYQIIFTPLALEMLGSILRHQQSEARPHRFENVFH